MAIAGLHLRQIAQAGTGGPTATAGFLRIGGVNHDAAPVTAPSLVPTPIYAKGAVNLSEATPWIRAALPSEVGLNGEEPTLDIRDLLSLLDGLHFEPKTAVQATVRLLTIGLTVT